MNSPLIDRDALLVCWVIMLAMWVAGFIVGRWFGRHQAWHELTVSVEGHWKKTDRKRKELDLLRDVSNAAIAFIALGEQEPKLIADLVAKVDAKKALRESVKKLQSFEEEKPHDRTDLPHG